MSRKAVGIETQSWSLSEPRDHGRHLLKHSPQEGRLCVNVSAGELLGLLEYIESKVFTLVRSIKTSDSEDGAGCQFERKALHSLATEPLRLFKAFHCPL
jgi:hypothetical protein